MRPRRRRSSARSGSSPASVSYVPSPSRSNARAGRRAVGIARPRGHGHRLAGLAGPPARRRSRRAAAGCRGGRADRSAGRVVAPASSVIRTRVECGRRPGRDRRARRARRSPGAKTCASRRIRRRRGCRTRSSRRGRPGPRRRRPRRSTSRRRGRARRAASARRARVRGVDRERPSLAPGVTVRVGRADRDGARPSGQRRRDPRPGVVVERTVAIEVPRVTHTRARARGGQHHRRAGPRRRGLHADRR